MKRIGFDTHEHIDIRKALEFQRRYGEVSTEIIDEVSNSLGIDFSGDNISRLVSEYGATNSRETLAEANSCEDKEDIVCNAIRSAFNKKIKEAGF